MGIVGLDATAAAKFGAAALTIKRVRLDAVPPKAAQQIQRLVYQLGAQLNMQVRVDVGGLFFKNLTITMDSAPENVSAMVVGLERLVNHLRAQGADTTIRYL